MKKQAMKDNLSPKDLARVLGVSESSIKRWIDEGLLTATRTPGGHRRVRTADALRFALEQNRDIVDLATLGVLASPLRCDPLGEEFAARLLEALAAGDAGPARQLLDSAVLSGTPIAALCDGPLRSALATLGERWLTREDGIFVEHRATEICAEFVQHVRGQNVHRDGSPLALGGAGPDEFHSLPSLMASAVLAGEGYRTVNLGASTPLATLLHAARQHEPAIVWLALAREHTGLDPQGQDLLDIVDWCRQNGAALVVGGTGARRLGLRDEPWLLNAASMRELAAFGRGLAARHPRAAHAGVPELLADPARR